MLADYLEYYWAIEPIYEFICDCDEISSMEELTKYDRIAAHLQSLFGDESLYPDYMSDGFEEYETEAGFCLGAQKF